MSEQNNIGNNKRIAKNTMMLYFRMMFMMLIGLYTSRIILDKLGEVDYGIYNVVRNFCCIQFLTKEALYKSIVFCSLK